MRLIIVLTFYFAMFGYPWMRLCAALDPTWYWRWWELAILLCAPITVYVGSRQLPSPWRLWLARGVYVWLGTSWILLTLSVPWELLYWLLPVPQEILAWALTAMLLLVVAYACYNANRFKVRTVQIRSNKLARPLRLLQLSDVHVGSRSSQFLKRVVDASNQLGPDAIVITGDLIDGYGIPRADLQALQDLTAPTYFIIGNHERYVDCDPICSRLRELGLIVLRDEVIQIDVQGNAMQLIGIDDAEAAGKVGHVLSQLELSDDAQLFSLLLYHRPDDLEAAADHGVDLMLCGHTHNGQLIPFNTLVKRRFPRIMGLYEHAGTQLYVSVGTGTWGPPMRLGSVNELTILELGPSAASEKPTH